MLGKKPNSGYMQTKWDGAPSVVCGKHPANGMFFVGTKSVFNKTILKFVMIKMMLTYTMVMLVLT